VRRPKLTPARRLRQAPQAPRAQQGAALLLAMVAVTLIATLAAGMVWQQYRAIQVEAAERARTQAGWILLGALDWSRLILREDARSSGVDHGGEPWATPLAEARLSTFLAAERGVATSDDGPEAFLSGTIVDAQARYNLRNLVGSDGKLVADELAVLTRLCAGAGLPSDLAARVGQALQDAWAPLDGKRAEAARSLPIRRFGQLAWLGIEPAAVNGLRTIVDILPAATPVNVNTASREVLAAVLDIDGGAAERLVQRRQRSPFESLDKLTPHLPEGTRLDTQRVSVSTNHFEVSGRLRLDERVLEERSLVMRRGSGNGAEVVTLHRERRSLQLPSS
jgi:general secretion pathway protein K